MNFLARNIAAAIAFGALSFAPAFANDMQYVTAESETKSLVVHFSDLDIDRQVDAEVLYGRLQSAAATVCSDLRRMASPLSGQMARSCTERSLDRAVSQVSAPLVDKLHNS